MLLYVQYSNLNGNINQRFILLILRCLEYILLPLIACHQVTSVEVHGDSLIKATNKANDTGRAILTQPTT